MLDSNVDTHRKDIEEIWHHFKRLPRDRALSLIEELKADVDDDWITYEASKELAIAFVIIMCLDELQWQSLLKSSITPMDQLDSISDLRSAVRRQFKIGLLTIHDLRSTQ